MFYEIKKFDNIFGFGDPENKFIKHFKPKESVYSP